MGGGYDPIDPQPYQNTDKLTSLFFFDVIVES